VGTLGDNCQQVTERGVWNSSCASLWLCSALEGRRPHRYLRKIYTATKKDLRLRQPAEPRDHGGLTRSVYTELSVLLSIRSVQSQDQQSVAPSLQESARWSPTRLSFSC
jgi:hypothetical protein